jgi:parallel beta-helix repeat protein
MKAQGLTVVATALAFTGPYDPGFLDGHVPTGPGITTAQPFLPDRDPARLFNSDLGPLEADGTLNPAPRAAALPGPGTSLDLALPADGSEPTVDTALVRSGSPTCVRLVERKGTGKHRVPAEPAHLTLGTAGGNRKAKLRLVAVDRLGNQTDPSAPLVGRVEVSGPLGFTLDKDGDPAAESVAITQANGRSLNLVAAAAGSGEVRVRLGGALCQRLIYESRPERNRNGADAVVGASHADFATIAAAVAGAADRNGDGRVTIEVAEGIFRETVQVDRAVELHGAGAGRTVVDARGLGPALAIADGGALVRDLTLSGGTSGVEVSVPATVSGLEARANLGAGFRLAAASAVATGCRARENGTEGFALEAAGAVGQCISAANARGGIVVRNAADGVVHQNLVTANGGDGIELDGADDAMVTDNLSAGNVGRGLSVEGSLGGVLAGNRAAGNDDDGLRLKDSAGTLVDRNDLTANGGWGIHVRESTAGFDAASGVQTPPGSNDVAANESGPVLIE